MKGLRLGLCFALALVCTAIFADDAAAAPLASPVVNVLTALGTVIVGCSTIYGILKNHRTEIFNMGAIPDVVAFCYRMAGGQGDGRVQAAIKMFGREFVQRTGATPNASQRDAAKYAIHALHLDVAGQNALTEPPPSEDSEMIEFNARRKAKGLPPLGPIAGLLVFALLLNLAGCGTSTNRQNGEKQESNSYEQGYQNLSDQYDAQEKANAVNHTKRLDLELKMDFASLASQAKLDPITWTPAAIAAETSRLQGLHDTKIADYAAAQAQFRALKVKNEQTNIATARKLRDALNPPAPAAPVDLTKQIQGNAGAPPATPLFQP